MIYIVIYDLYKKQREDNIMPVEVNIESQLNEILRLFDSSIEKIIQAIELEFNMRIDKTLYDAEIK